MGFHCLLRPSTRPEAMPELRAPLEVWYCNVMKQTEAVEESSSWTDDEPYRLITPLKLHSSQATGHVVQQVSLSVAMIRRHPPHTPLADASV